MDSVRVDRWLCAARIFKSRTLAQRACTGGQVHINGVAVRPSHPVRVGDEVRATAPRGAVALRVVGLAERRLSAPLARELYEDHSPPPLPKDEWLARRQAGAGRPTKADRRAIQRLRRRA